MTVSEKHIAAAIDLVDSEMFKGLMAVDRIGKCAEMVAAALAAAEREGMRRAAEIVRERIPHVPPDGPINTEHQAEYEALGFAMMAILSQANTHSVALPPPSATEAGSVQPSADPATHHASRNGRGEQ